MIVTITRNEKIYDKLCFLFVVAEFEIGLEIKSKNGTMQLIKYIIEISRSPN